jgi:prolyl 4-hydroxylase
MASVDGKDFGKDFAGVLMQHTPSSNYAAIFPQTEALGFIIATGRQIKTMNSTPQTTEQHWLQAKTLITEGNTLAALPHLRLAAAAQHPTACFNLGCLHIFKLIEDADKTLGVSLIQQAAELKHGGAFYQLGMLELSKPEHTPDWQYISECLWQSAQLRYPIALRTMANVWSHSRDSELLKLGTLCLEYAALGGDLVSLGLLMHRIKDGIGCAQNTFRANAINTLLLQTDLPIDAFNESADPRFAEAQHLANLPELPKPDLTNVVWKTPITLLSESPWVGIADHVLNSEECHLVRYLGGPHVEPSITANNDGTLVKVALRSSFDMEFTDIQEDMTLLFIQRRMATLIDTTPAYAEPLHLLRYQNGQEYRPHRDYLPSNLYKPLHEGGEGQRNYTAIVYLNKLVTGGETEFIELNKKIAPEVGRVLVFRNLHEDGSPDTRTLHAGLPVRFGTKWIATLWIHQGIFRK